MAISGLLKFWTIEQEVTQRFWVTMADRTEWRGASVIGKKVVRKWVLASEELPQGPAVLVESCKAPTMLWCWEALLNGVIVLTRNFELLVLLLSELAEDDALYGRKRMYPWHDVVLP